MERLARIFAPLHLDIANAWNEHRKEKPEVADTWPELRVYLESRLGDPGSRTRAEPQRADESTPQLTENV